MVAALATTTSRSTTSQPREQEPLAGAPQDGDVFVPPRERRCEPDAVGGVSVGDEAAVPQRLHREDG